MQTGQLTNAADVLFGKKAAQRHPQIRLRAVTYSTDRAGDFVDEQLYEGTAFHLLEDAMAFLKRHVAIGAEFREGRLPRESRPRYPFFALREGLVNALVHRDYAAFSGSVSVSVYPDRVEIWNSGKLPARNFTARFVAGVSFVDPRESRYRPRVLPPRAHGASRARNVQNRARVPRARDAGSRVEERGIGGPVDHVRCPAWTVGKRRPE